MQIFLLDHHNSRFVTITPENLRRYSFTNFIWDYQITEESVCKLIKEEKVKLESSYNPILWLLYDYLGQPYKDFGQWKYQLQIKVNQIAA